MGDGVLLEFPSVVAAVDCAIAMQKLFAERNAGLAEGKRILYRVGVNLGDVLIEGDDILGDGVNVAARLEQIAEPGGVCLSSAAYDHVRGRVEANFIDRGEQRLKNMQSRPRIFALCRSDRLSASSVSGRSRVAITRRPSVCGGARRSARAGAHRGGLDWLARVDIASAIGFGHRGRG